MTRVDSEREPRAAATLRHHTTHTTQRVWPDATRTEGTADETLVFTRPPLQDALETVDVETGLELLEVLGEGGMSIVHSATQAGLARRVAVKLLPEEDRDGVCASELIREAVVTGMLEHPNVVPVYAAGRAHDGSPALVMRQIAGTHWSDVMVDEDWSVEEHIEVLMTVCRAVHFAHTRGIVHRDIKPDNVMLGDLGEIYLLDWGLAVTTREDLPAIVPRAHELETPAGTPAYWAPEMALGLSVDERTDVYLLGAVLHEIVAGEPPHAADTVHQAVMSAVERGGRFFDDETPSELAAICRRAMAYDPADRHDSVDELRLALGEYLQHSASRRLAGEAQARAEQLVPLLACDEPDAAQVHKLFTESRFAYEQALREWEDNADARHGLDRIIEKMADYHIRRESYDSARALIEELPMERETLDRRLLSLVDSIQKRNSDIDELQRLRHANDLAVGAQVRRCLWLSVGVWLTACTLAIGASVGFDLTRASYLHGWLLTLLLLGALIATQPWINRQLENDINRKFHRSLYGYAFVAQLLLAGSQVAGVAFSSAIAVLLAGLAGASTLMAITFHRRFGVSAPAYAASAGLVALFPEFGFLTTAGAFAAALGAARLVESRRPEQGRPIS